MSESKAPVQPPRAQPSVEELMQQADASAKAGDRNAAQQKYRAAARAYPTSKLPWLKLAEESFAALDYGNAILAADEVLQRDPNDRVALSIVTVGGLRASGSAIAKLRTMSDLPTDRRREAYRLADELRTALGVTDLGLRPTATPAPSAGQVSPTPPVTGAGRSPSATGRQPSSPTTPTPTTPRNPLDKL